MNRKSFIALFLALLFPWRKRQPVFEFDKPKLQTSIRNGNELHLDSIRVRVKETSGNFSAHRLAELRKRCLEHFSKQGTGKSWEEINDPERPHHLGYFVHEVSA